MLLFCLSPLLYLVEEIKENWSLCSPWVGQQGAINEGEAEPGAPSSGH